MLCWWELNPPWWQCLCHFLAIRAFVMLYLLSVIMCLKCFFLLTWNHLNIYLQKLSSAVSSHVPCTISRIKNFLELCNGCCLIEHKVLNVEYMRVLYTLLCSYISSMFLSQYSYLISIFVAGTEKQFILQIPIVCFAHISFFMFLNAPKALQ